LVFDIPNVLSMYTLVGDKAARVISDAALAIIEN
jgi:hypothetical protein